jgi:hypothetical protein
LADQKRGNGDQKLPDAEAMAERFRAYRLDKFGTTLREFPDTKADIHFDPDNTDLREFYVRAPVESLDDLKLWTGVPNDRLSPEDTRHLKCVSVPAPQTIMETGLDPQLIADAEHNIRFGYVDDKLLSNPFWKLVADGMLERWRSINILLLQDLVVYDGQTVTLSNTQTAFFRKVTVHPTGVIDVQSDTKIIADTVEHIAAP